MGFGVRGPRRRPAADSHCRPAPALPCPPPPTTTTTLSRPGHPARSLPHPRHRWGVGVYRPPGGSGHCGGLPDRGAGLPRGAWAGGGRWVGGVECGLLLPSCCDCPPPLCRHHPATRPGRPFSPTHTPTRHPSPPPCSSWWTPLGGAGWQRRRAVLWTISPWWWCALPLAQPLQEGAAAAVAAPRLAAARDARWLERACIAAPPCSHIIPCPTHPFPRLLNRMRKLTSLFSLPATVTCALRVLWWCGVVGGATRHTWCACGTRTALLAGRSPTPPPPPPPPPPNRVAQGGLGEH